MLVPKLVTTLKTYTRAQLFADLTAGVIVGIVALPLAIAFAIDSTVMPALRDLIRRTRQVGTLVLLSDVHSQPRIALGRSERLDEIGRRVQGPWPASGGADQLQLVNRGLIQCICSRS